jgi:hypothetical protein
LGKWRSSAEPPRLITLASAADKPNAIHERPVNVSAHAHSV